MVSHVPEKNWYLICSIIWIRRFSSDSVDLSISQFRIAKPWKHSMNTTSDPLSFNSSALILSLYNHFKWYNVSPISYLNLNQPQRCIPLASTFRISQHSIMLSIESRRTLPSQIDCKYSLTGVNPDTTPHWVEMINKSPNFTRTPLSSIQKSIHLLGLPENTISSPQVRIPYFLSQSQEIRYCSREFLSRLPTRGRLTPLWVENNLCFKFSYAIQAPVLPVWHLDIQ